jgi:hypothetical protein
MPGPVGSPRSRSTSASYWPISWSSSNHRRNEDDRLPLRWALIVSVAVAMGIVTGGVAGLAAGIGAALATAVALTKIISS